MNYKIISLTFIVLIQNISLYALTNSNYIDIRQYGTNMISIKQSLMANYILIPLMNFVQKFGLSYAWGILAMFIVFNLLFATYDTLKNKNNFFKSFFKFSKALWYLYVVAIFIGIVGQMRYGK